MICGICERQYENCDCVAGTAVAPQEGRLVVIINAERGNMMDITGLPIYRQVNGELQRVKI